jgi:hypothetical protein
MYYCITGMIIYDDTGKVIFDGRKGIFSARSTVCLDENLEILL